MMWKKKRDSRIVYQERFARIGFPQKFNVCGRCRFHSHKPPLSIELSGGIPMPRRDVLTPTERAQLFAFPDDEGELIRLRTLSRTDLTFIRHHRGDHNRLGIAVQMTYLRYPSRVLGESEAPHPPLLGIVAAQLKVAPAAIAVSPNG
jgi:Domain of unknown function (DUF4158)